jgi:hypothetical protein
MRQYELREMGDRSSWTAPATEVQVRALQVPFLRAARIPARQVAVLGANVDLDRAEAACKVADKVIRVMELRVKIQALGGKR